MILLKVEAGVGSDISEVCREAFRIALILNVIVEFDFNGASMYVRPIDTVEECIKRYWESCKGENRCQS